MRINRAVVEHDVTLIVGPVFPHEVVGFSGGNKYLFPGVSGQEMIDVSHWLGALITSAEIIGTRGSRRSAPSSTRPPRWSRRAAARCRSSRSPARPACTRPPSATRGVLGGGGRRRGRDPRPLPRRARAPGAVADPAQYDDMWTGAKGFYKVEPIVADGGEVVLYAPHIREISAMHPRDRRDRLPLPRLLRRPVGPLQATSRGATSRTPPTCAAPARATPSRASALGSR